eukprot:jgi/Tetstr1/437407/TSEL_026089.t1
MQRRLALPDVVWHNTEPGRAEKGPLRHILDMSEYACMVFGTVDEVSSEGVRRKVDDVMGVGEDPVGEDGMDIDAPAWPPAGVEPAMRA